MWVFQPHVWTCKTWDKYTYVVTTCNPLVIDHSTVTVDPGSLLRLSPGLCPVLHPDRRRQQYDHKTKMT
eukprot:3940933-Rhodomonas_salina.2